jgi:hypothetical protein
MIVGSFIGYMISECAKVNIFRDHDSARILEYCRLELSKMNTAQRWDSAREKTDGAQPR